MISINIDDFRTEIDNDFLSILLIVVIDKLFFSDFDFYRFPISIDNNQRIKSINLDDID